MKKINPANILQGSFHFYMCFGHGQTTTELYFNLLSLGWTISRDKINCYTSKISGLCDKMFHRNPSKFSFLILRYFNLFFPICSDQGIYYGKKWTTQVFLFQMYVEFWRISKEHFIKNKPFITDESCKSTDCLNMKPLLSFWNLCDSPWLTLLLVVNTYIFLYNWGKIKISCFL